VATVPLPFQVLPVFPQLKLLNSNLWLARSPLPLLANRPLMMRLRFQADNPVRPLVQKWQPVAAFPVFLAADNLAFPLNP
jgi:hypothetical protein